MATNNNDFENEIPDIGSADRGEVSLAGKKTDSKKIIGFTVFSVAVLLIVTIFGYVAYSKIQAQKAEEASAKLALPNETLQTKKSDDTHTLTSSMADVMRAQKEAEAAKAEAERRKKLADEQAAKNKPVVAAQLPQPQVASNQQKQASAPGSSNGQHEITPQERKMMGSTLVNLSDSSAAGSVSSGAINPMQKMQQQGMNGLAGMSGGSGNHSMNDMLQGETYDNGTATVLNNIPYRLTHGTILPCVLKTKIVTSYKGLVLCQISQDVLSMNGETILIPRGSMAFGEQKQAITQGVARVFINWNEVDTPGDKPIRMRIDSLGTDSLGASGAEAWVDYHFWERFGGAIMLSLIDDSFQTVANSAESSNSTVSYSNTTNNTESMANEALKNSINIAPTGVINQGDMINILVARDLDLSNVYQNR